jgi:hypothetical protein
MASTRWWLKYDRVLPIHCGFTRRIQLSQWRRFWRNSAWPGARRRTRLYALATAMLSNVVGRTRWRSRRRTT